MRPHENGAGSGKRRREIEAWLSGPQGPPALIAGRVLPFGKKAGLAWAKLMADREARGRPHNALDSIIPAIDEAKHSFVVADNEKHFEGVEIIKWLRVVG